jgi:hypothetical protein
MVSRAGRAQPGRGQDRRVPLPSRFDPGQHLSHSGRPSLALVHSRCVTWCTVGAGGRTDRCSSHGPSPHLPPWAEPSPEPSPARAPRPIATDGRKRAGSTTPRFPDLPLNCSFRPTSSWPVAPDFRRRSAAPPCLVAEGSGPFYGYPCVKRQLRNSCHSEVLGRLLPRHGDWAAGE